MKYLIVNPGGTTVQGEGVLDADVLHSLVGGDFEVMPTPDGLKVTVLASTDAKRLGQPANHAATRLLKTRLRPDDFVAGTIVVVGPINEEGDVTDLDDDTGRAVVGRMTTP